MIRIGSNTEEYILDLNLKPFNEHRLRVVSKDDDGNQSSWGIELVSSPEIVAVGSSNDTLEVSLDADSLSEDVIIVLKNYEMERLVVRIIHNEELSRPKKYKFRVTRKKVEGRKLSIRILSKEDDREAGWACTYAGKPLNYRITPTRSDRSGSVEIELLDELFTSIDTVIEFTQDKSGEVIRLNISQDNNGIKTK